MGEKKREELGPTGNGGDHFIFWGHVVEEKLKKDETDTKAIYLTFTRLQMVPQGCDTVDEANWLELLEHKNILRITKIIP